MKETMITDEQTLQNFLLDIQCLDELLPWTEKFNIFDILKISKAEIRHSNMLAWLLDSNENHGLGDAFVKEIVQRIVKHNTLRKQYIFHVLLADMYSFTVQREWKNIDILLVSEEEKIIMAIENKVKSHEHSNQLNRYRIILEKEYPDFKRFYVYLTSDGEEPSDGENWDILTYTDVVEVLENLTKRVKLQQDASIMIKNYIEVIRRDVVEDKQLIEICNKIYKKHKRALDLIYNNRVDSKTQIRNGIDDVLTRLHDEGKIIHDADWGSGVFTTEEMDKMLPDLPTSDSSWGSTNIYAYWLDCDEKHIWGIYELAGLNIPKKDFRTMQKIIAELKPRDNKKDVFKSKTLFKTKKYELRDVEDMGEEVERVVRNIVNELLAMEESLLVKIK